MKSLRNYIINLWKWLFPDTITKINRKLRKAALAELKQRYKVKSTIAKDLHKAFGISFTKKSKFIPAKGHNKTKLYLYIQQKFGQEMSKVSLKLNRELIWK